MRERRLERGAGVGPWFGAWDATALALTVVVALGLVAILVEDGKLAGRLAVEDGLLESVQVVLFASSGVLAFRRAVRRARDGRPVAATALLAVQFGSLVSGELDVDKRLIGAHIVHTAFFVRPTIWLPYRVLAALILGAIYATLLVYAWRHRAELRNVLIGSPREAWVRLWFIGAAVFGTVELIERPLNRLSFLPRFFAEESLELIAAIYFLLALIALARRPADAPDA